MADKLECALDLMRILPPQIEKNLARLIDLVPDFEEQLLSTIDQPLKVAHDLILKRDYFVTTIVIETRNIDCSLFYFIKFFYKSPWSNNYKPSIEDGELSSPH